MTLNQSLRIWGENFFRLTYVENDGIVFGIEFGGRLFLIITTILAVILLIYFISTLKDYPLLPKLALAAILGGALGNLVDRIVTGRVVDFLDFDFPDFIMDRWPVFNVADSAVSVGMTILVIYMLFFSSRKPISSLETHNAANHGGDKDSGFTEPDQGEN